MTMQRRMQKQILRNLAVVPNAQCRVKCRESRRQEEEGGHTTQFYSGQGTCDCMICASQHYKDWAHDLDLSLNGMEMYP